MPVILVQRNGHTRGLQPLFRSDGYSSRHVGMSVIVVYVENVFFENMSRSISHVYFLGKQLYGLG